jgi:transcriptional regulator with XRE-family HTH domain
MTHTGELLKALRKEALLTQAQLAERTGIQRGEISKLENGPLKCTLASTRRRLAKGYGVPLELFDDYLEGRVTLEELIEARIVAESP